MRQGEDEAFDDYKCALENLGDWLQQGMSEGQLLT